MEPPERRRVHPFRDEEQIPATFPPIPLVTGNTLVSEDGTPHPIDSVTVTITAADGTTQTIELTNHHGGWWIPFDRKQTP